VPKISNVSSVVDTSTEVYGGTDTLTFSDASSDNLPNAKT
jgi:hypothetical protein